MRRGRSGADRGTRNAVIVVATMLGVSPGALECQVGPPSGAALEMGRRTVEIGHDPVSVLVLDLDGDGDLDVASGTRGGIVVLLGDGAGGLRLAETVPAGPGVGDVAAGDLDEDGWTDLVVSNHETDFVTIRFGSPGGFADGRSAAFPVGVSPHPHEVELADLDGDGHLDLLVDDRNAGALRSFRGRGDGGFSPSDPIDVGGDPYLRVAVADLDGDGDPDVATPNERSVAIRLGDGSGGFVPVPDLTDPGMRPFSVAAGDFSGDGRPDLAVGGGEGEAVLHQWVATGPGEWRLRSGPPLSVGGGPTEVTIGDVDGDGTGDVSVTAYTGEGITVLLGGPEGRNPIRIADPGSRPWGVDSGDLDGDGLHEIVTADNGRGSISVHFVRTGGASPDGD